MLREKKQPHTKTYGYRRFTFGTLFLFLVVALSLIRSTSYAFTNPSNAPPAGGVLTITSGNIGVGNPSPVYNLDVNGDVRWTGILQGGSVPWARVTGFTGDASADTIADDGIIALGTETSGTYDSTSDTIADDGVISDNEASDILTINNGLLYAPISGSVGVGTATPNPSYKLEVNGFLNATQLCIGGVCKSSW